MQRVSVNDYMSGSAKRAIDTAIANAKAQRVGGATPAAPATMAEQPQPALGASR